jgi:hypothetical protein
MKKNTLVLLLAAVLIVFNNGCTSSETPEDQQQVENADIEKIETIDGGEEANKPAEKPAEEAQAEKKDATADEASLEASLNEPAPSDAGAAKPDEMTTTTTATESKPEATTTTTTASEPAPPPVADPTSTPTVDEKSLNASADAPPPVSDSQLAPDPALSASAPTEPAPTPAVTEAPTTDNTTAISSAIEPTPSAPKHASSPMKKISAVTPYQAKSGGWVNTVYIARPGEKLADISMKIFGADKTKDLKGIAENSYLKSRSVKAGDKIYYVSPNRPDDSSRTILYYEDMGMIPETYVAKKGESLRKVSKQLLGYDNAWKEMWASNGVESKTTLKDGETLRYWKPGAETMVATPPMSPPVAGGAAVTTEPPVATATTAPPATTEMPPPPPADTTAAAGTAGQPSLPPPPTDANATLPPPPADAAAATAAPPPPPADETAGASVPPPPPAVEEAPPADAGDAGAAKVATGKKKLDQEAEAEEGEGLNSDTLMSMGALGVLLGLLAFVIIRKRKQKSQMNNLEMNA